MQPMGMHFGSPVPQKIREKNILLLSPINNNYIYLVTKVCVKGFSFFFSFFYINACTSYICFILYLRVHVYKNFPFTKTIVICEFLKSEFYCCIGFVFPFFKNCQINTKCVVLVI